MAAALMAVLESVPVEIDMFFRRSYRTDYSFVVLIFMSIITQSRLSQQLKTLSLHLPFSVFL